VFRKYEDLPKIKLPFGEVFVSDSTLRDGSQMPGIVLNKKHRLDIFEFLHKIGIEKTECFLFHERDRSVAREMLDRGYKYPEVTGWSRAVKADIDLVLKTDGIKETGILMSISAPHVFDKLGLKTKEEAEEKYLNALQYAVDHGLRPRCHLEDITRADIDGFVIPFMKKVLEISPNVIIRVCDTLGLGLPFENVGSPFSIPKTIQKLRKIGVKDIETHMHDDFGFSIVNSVAGYWYGANWSNLTFLGIGERAGNAELEKVLVFLVNRVEGFEKYDISHLSEFAKYMEKEVGFFIPRNKAVVGKNIFTHESGIHTAGVIKNPFIYEPFPPELVGAKRRLVIGDTSGLNVVKLKVEEVLKEMGKPLEIEKDDPRLKSIFNDIQRLYEEGRRSNISDEELKAYVEKYFL
jgi:isopropylmalate/homocitrate/citramalate synthase